MAKEGKGTNIYLLAIVSIVAIVGIVIFVNTMNQEASASFVSEDITGQAVQCRPCPGNTAEWVCGDTPCSKPAKR